MRLTYPIQPLLFSLFGWCFCGVASILIVFVVFLLLFLLYETVSKEPVRPSKLLITTLMQSQEDIKPIGRNFAQFANWPDQLGR